MAARWTRAQLAEWGVRWPPPDGWVQRLLNQQAAQATAKTGADMGTPAEVKRPKAMRRATIHADGGCSPNPGVGGWAYIVEFADGDGWQCSGAEPEATNNSMELTAILQGLQSLPEPCRVLVVSDSRYAVRGLSQWLPAWSQRDFRNAAGDVVANADLWREIFAETQRHDVRGRWVRGHKGHPENEECDRLATAARLALATV